MEDNDCIERKKPRYEQNLEEARKKAIAEWDSVAYIKATELLGLDLDEVPGLADDGYDKMALEQGGLKNLNGLEKATIESLSNSDLDKNTKFTSILNLHSPKTLYTKMNRTMFKGIFGRLKRAGYKGPGGEDMKDYGKMNTADMWNYISEIRKDLEV